jgi:predicted transcriptional regulator
VTREEELDIRADLLAGGNLGKKKEMKKVLTYVMTTLGGTFVEQMVEVEEEERV